MANLNTVLCVINSALKSLEEIRLHANLVCLNLHCNKITEISGLNACPNLKHLDLSFNKIRTIHGLEHLTNLVTLNLSANKIEKVENICSLQTLVACNLSYNNIHNLDGFKLCAKLNYRLEILDLRGNNLDSIDHLLSCLKFCHHLRHLLLSKDCSIKKRKLSISSTAEDSDYNRKSEENPICSISGYRRAILKPLINLVSVDGFDRRGRKVEFNNVEHFSGYDSYFAISESSETEKLAENILQLQNHYNFKENKTKSMLSQNLMTDKFDSRPLSISSNSATTAVMSVKQFIEVFGDQFLKIIEDKLDAIKYRHPVSGKSSNTPVLKSDFREKLANSNNVVVEGTSNKDIHQLKNVSDKMISKKNETSSLKSAQQSKHQEYVDVHQLSNISENIMSSDHSLAQHSALKEVEFKSYFKKKKSAAPLMSVESSSKQDNISKNFAGLMDNWEKEKELRWKAEKMVMGLRRQLKEETEEKKEVMKKLEGLQNIAELKKGSEFESLQQVQSLFEIEKRQNEEITKQFELSHEIIQDLNKQREDVEKQKIEIESDLKKLKEKFVEIEKEKFEFEKLLEKDKQENHLKLVAFKREVELLRNICKQQKEKISELQTLMTTKDQHHITEMSQYLSKNSHEFQEYLELQIAVVKTPLLLKIEDLEKSYVDLEGEFREGLRSELIKYETVKEAFMSSEQSLAECMKENEGMKEKLRKNQSLIAEMNSIIKEQKGRLSGLVSSKQEQTSELKSRVKILEKELETKRLDLEEFAGLRQERTVLKGRLESLESLVLGLKSEKRIWSEELAQQSSALAQDKGRLQSKIESLQHEVKKLDTQLSDELEQNRIKSKIIEDNLDTIKKLKLVNEDKEKELQQILQLHKTKSIEVNQEIEHLSKELEMCEEKKEEICNRLMVAGKMVKEKEEESKKLKEEWKRMKKEIQNIESKVVEITEVKAAHQQQMKELEESISSKYEQKLLETQRGHHRQLVSIETETQMRVRVAEGKVREVEREMREILMEREEEKKESELRMAKFAKLIHEFTGTIT